MSSCHLVDSSPRCRIDVMSWSSEVARAQRSRCCRGVHAGVCHSALGHVLDPRRVRSRSCTQVPASSICCPIRRARGAEQSCSARRRRIYPVRVRCDPSRVMACRYYCAVPFADKLVPRAAVCHQTIGSMPPSTNTMVRVVIMLERLFPETKCLMPIGRDE